MLMPWVTDRCNGPSSPLASSELRWDRPNSWRHFEAAEHRARSTVFKIALGACRTEIQHTSVWRKIASSNHRCASRRRLRCRVHRLEHTFESPRRLTTEVPIGGVYVAARVSDDASRRPAQTSILPRTFIRVTILVTHSRSKRRARSR